MREKLWVSLKIAMKEVYHYLPIFAQDTMGRYSPITIMTHPCLSAGHLKRF